MLKARCWHDFAASAEKLSRDGAGRMLFFHDELNCRDFGSKRHAQVRPVY
ncbi:MAG: hypothetical protein MUD12_13145 [Spirochaetes bacterium]|nr:hypothetical protein [Spirochaetota bacterium]